MERFLNASLRFQVSTIHLPLHNESTKNSATSEPDITSFQFLMESEAEAPACNPKKRLRFHSNAARQDEALNMLREAHDYATKDTRDAFSIF